MQLNDLRLLRDTLEQYAAGGMPWLPDKHQDTRKCLRILRKEIRAIAKQNKENADANSLVSVQKEHPWSEP